MAVGLLLEEDVLEDSAVRRLQLLPDPASHSDRRAYGVVLHLLRERHAMPYLELSVLSELDDSKLSEVLGRFEQQKVVKIYGRGNTMEEIVTLNPNRLY